MTRDATAGRWWPPMRRALATAVTTMLAIILTIASIVPLAPAVGPVVMGAMLALTLSRSQLERDARGRLEAAVALPVIGLVAAGVGALLLDLRIVGAVVFVLGMTASIWLSRFGPVARRIGGLLALPFIALLVAPAPIPRHPTGPLAGAAWLIPIVVALIAFAWVTLVQLGSRAIGLLPRRARAWERPAATPPPDGGTPPRWRLRPTDKLALQMGLALALAFSIGFVFFSDRWAWIVLTVVVVAIGNAGRADVLYKGIQRIVGAGIGTLLALVPPIHLGPPSVLTVVVLVAIVFVGLFAREFAYVWWALFFTLALLIIQGFAGGPDGGGGGFLLGSVSRRSSSAPRSPSWWRGSCCRSGRRARSGAGSASFWRRCRPGCRCRTTTPPTSSGAHSPISPRCRSRTTRGGGSSGVLAGPAPRTGSPPFATASTSRMAAPARRRDDCWVPRGAACATRTSCRPRSTC